MPDGRSTSRATAQSRQHRPTRRPADTITKSIRPPRTDPAENEDGFVYLEEEDIIAATDESLGPDAHTSSSYFNIHPQVEDDERQWHVGWEMTNGDGGEERVSLTRASAGQVLSRLYAGGQGVTRYMTQKRLKEYGRRVTAMITPTATISSGASEGYKRFVSTWDIAHRASSGSSRITASSRCLRTASKHLNKHDRA